MSWRLLLFGAAVIVVLFGGWSVVFSSGSPDRSPSTPGSHPRRTDQEIVGTWTPFPASSADLEGCEIPSNAAEGTKFTCLRTFP
jgi:hypothetical protein